MSLKVLFANILFMLRRSRTFFAPSRPEIPFPSQRQTPDNASAVQSLIRADLAVSANIDSSDITGPLANLAPVEGASGQSVSNSGGSSDGRPVHAQGLAPKHVAIIMDGNNRWAKKHPMSGVSGHKAGVETIRSVLDSCDHHGVEVLTLFAFSSENWARPQREVNELMALFKEYLNSEVKELHKKGIRLRFIGRRDRLEQSLRDRMDWAEQLTYRNTGRVLVLAVDYGGRWDICQAVDSLVSSALENGKRWPEGALQLTEDEISGALQISDLPEPDLCIRTGGEFRVSNFMLWQFSYSEFYFTEKLWPDFNAEDFSNAIDAFAGRERRFGCTSEQVASIRNPGRSHA